MGYFLTSTPENAVPANPLATPKTHVPGSRMSNLGQRYYSPSLGRWISRDPIGEEGGLDLAAFVQNMPVDRIDVVGLSILPTIPNPFHLTSKDATPDKCAEIKSLMGFWAVGANQTLWDWWLNGPPSSQTQNGVTDVPYDWFDAGNDSSPTLDKGIKHGLAHAKKLKCSGKGSEKWGRKLRPLSHTRMISYYDLKVDCVLSWEAVWDSKCCKCKSVSAKADCDLTASDRVDFWDDPKKGFWLPPYYVDDQFILACNYGGKGVNTGAKGHIVKDTGPRDCRFSFLPPLPF